MKALLDTHVFLWWILGQPGLSDRVRDIIADSDGQMFVSAASGWEIAIKAQLGKLVIPDPPDRFVEGQMAANSFASLPVRMQHALGVYRLPMHHRDPFDRILIVQSRMEALPILTADSSFSSYDVEVVW